jgi:hypothetical protein
MAQVAEIEHDAVVALASRTRSDWRAFAWSRDASIFGEQSLPWIRFMRTLVALAICLTSTVGASEEIPKVRIVDLPRNEAQLLGRKVTVTGCAFAQATATQAICTPSSSANPGGPTLLLLTKDMPNETFDRLLRSCIQLADVAAERCRGSATGILQKTRDSWQLSDVIIAWEN